MALENKLGITSSAELAREEERISKESISVIWKCFFSSDIMKFFCDALF